MSEPTVSEARVPANGVASIEILATINGDAIDELPQGLYVPNNPLKVLLENFTGPLDLLLYLVRKNKIDIMQIPIAEIARQYNEFIHLMEIFEIEQVAEYLWMAAWLSEAKSRMLNPLLAITDDEDESDPRAALSEMMRLYEVYQKASQWLNEQQWVDRDVILPEVNYQTFIPRTEKPVLHLNQLVDAFEALLNRQMSVKPLDIVDEPVIEIEHKIPYILRRLSGSREPVSFYHLCIQDENRMGIVVTFLAILALLNEEKIDLIPLEVCMDKTYGEDAAASVGGVEDASSIDISIVLIAWKQA